MSNLMNDANAPVVFQGQEYGALTMQDAARLGAAIPIADDAKALLDIADILKFARSPRGIPLAIKIAAEKTGVTMNGMSTGDQISLVMLLIARFYGVEEDDSEVEDSPDPLSLTGEK